MICGAHIRIPLPFSPVPLTLQTGVLFVSLPLLKRKASFVQLIYIVLGVVGMPFFSRGGSGLLYLLGPTGGYLVGFLIVALVFPRFMDTKKSFLAFIGLFTAANVVIYATGVSWLMLFNGFNLTAAFIAGVFPFIMGDLLKIITAGVVSCKLAKC